nr:hypothetical protein [Nesterenkonia sp. NBAIMH1]
MRGDLAPVGPDVVISDRHHQRLLPQRRRPIPSPLGHGTHHRSIDEPFSHPCARGAAVHQNKIRLGIVPPPQPLQLRRAPPGNGGDVAEPQLHGASGGLLRRCGELEQASHLGKRAPPLLGQGRLPGHSTHQLDVPRLLERPQPARDLSLRNAQSDRGVRQRPLVCDRDEALCVAQIPIHTLSV